MKIKIRPYIQRDKSFIDTRSLIFTPSDTTNSLIDCVRELLQNSWDAFIGNNKIGNIDKFKFKITLNKFNKDLLPFNDYANYLKQSNDYYSMLIKRDNDDKDKHCKEINDTFLKIIDDQMYYLNIEDNSGGLEGTTMYTDEKHGSKALLQQDMSVKGNNSNSKLGTYGKGKYTSILHSPIRTVFYINQRGDKKYFVGSSEINSYSFKVEGEEKLKKYKGKQFYWGKLIDSEDQCDWIELDENNKSIKDLRFINADGLSTIITTNQRNIDWMNECAYSIISSFFTIIEDERVDIQIEDRTQSKPLFYKISNHQEIVDTINKIKKSNFYSKNENKDKVQDEFHKIEHFVKNDNPEIYEEEFALKVDDEKRKYNIKLKLFQAGETKDGIKKDYFSFVRDGMLLRKQNMLMKNLMYTNNSKFYGYVYSDNKILNGILSQFEPPSHDEFITTIHGHGENLPLGLPKGRELASFINKIKDWVHKIVNENCFGESNLSKKTTWIFQGQNNLGQSNETESPSYTRNYKLKENDFKRISPNSISLLTEGEILLLDKNGDKTTHKLDPKGDYVEYVRRKPIKIIYDPPGPPNPDPPVEKRKVNKKKPDQPAIARTGLVHPKYFRSKLIKKEKEISNYTINFDELDLSNINTLRIKQQSLGATKASSFKIKKAFLNGHRIVTILPIKKDRLQPMIVFAYDLRIDQTHKSNKSNIDLNLEIEELNSTFSSFEISIQN